MNYLGLLGIILVIAKIAGYIAWSWWLVLLPFYGGLAVVLAFYAIFGVGVAGMFGVAAIIDFVAARRRNRSRR